MTKAYHELKLQEQREALLIQLKAILDYNAMMGILDDPEEAEEGETDE